MKTSEYAIIALLLVILVIQAYQAYQAYQKTESYGWWWDDLNNEYLMNISDDIRRSIIDR